MAMLIRNTDDIDIQCNAELDLVNSVLKFYCSTSDEGQYSISDAQGQIISKGVYHGDTTVCIADLAPGYYNLIIFNSLSKKIIPFKI